MANTKWHAYSLFSKNPRYWHRSGNSVAKRERSVTAKRFVAHSDDETHASRIIQYAEAKMRFFALRFVQSTSDRIAALRSYINAKIIKPWNEANRNWLHLRCRQSFPYCVLNCGQKCTCNGFNVKQSRCTNTWHTYNGRHFQRAFTFMESLIHIHLYSIDIACR